MLRWVVGPAPVRRPPPTLPAEGTAGRAAYNLSRKLSRAWMPSFRPLRSGWGAGGQTCTGGGLAAWVGPQVPGEAKALADVQVGLHHKHGAGPARDASTTWSCFLFRTTWMPPTFGFRH